MTKTLAQMNYLRPARTGRTNYYGHVLDCVGDEWRVWFNDKCVIVCSSLPEARGHAKRRFFLSVRYQPAKKKRANGYRMWPRGRRYGFYPNTQNHYLDIVYDKVTVHRVDLHPERPDEALALAQLWAREHWGFIEPLVRQGLYIPFDYHDVRNRRL